MRTLTEALETRVLLGDGQLQVGDLDLARDLYGAEGCIDVLNLTRAPLVRDAHIAYLEAGADVIRTNTQGASPLSLRAHGLAEDAFCINYSAAQIACEAVDSVPGRGRRRFVLGMVCDQGQDQDGDAPPAAIEDAVSVQVEGLIAGGVDGVALTLDSGAACARMFLNGAQQAKDRLHSAVPIFLQRPAGAPEFSDGMQASADGVIRIHHGRTHNGQMGRLGWLDSEVLAQSVNLIDGGSSPADTTAIGRLLRARAEDGLRPRSVGKADEIQPASSTLYPAPERVVAKAS